MPQKLAAVPGSIPGSCATQSGRQQTPTMQQPSAGMVPRHAACLPSDLPDPPNQKHQAWYNSLQDGFSKEELCDSLAQLASTFGPWAEYCERRLLAKAQRASRETVVEYAAPMPVQRGTVSTPTVVPVKEFAVPNFDSLAKDVARILRSPWPRSRQNQLALPVRAIEDINSIIEKVESTVSHSSAYDMKRHAMIVFLTIGEDLIYPVKPFGNLVRSRIGYYSDLTDAMKSVLRTATVDERREMSKTKPSTSIKPDEHRSLRSALMDLASEAQGYVALEELPGAIDLLPVEEDASPRDERTNDTEPRADHIK